MTNEKSNEESTTMMAASPEPEDPVEPQSEDDKKENVSQTEDGSESADKQEPSCQQKAWRKWCDFYAENEFVVLVIVVICLARAYPPLGADYLQPQITSTWIAVIFIFIMAGLGLKTEEFAKALQRFKFNLFVQCFNFGVVSSVVFGVSRGLVEVGAIAQGLADGMVVCASLPLTINMVLVLTKASGGDEAAAIFNAAFGNMCGVFLSPVLILGYLGVTSDVNLVEVFYKLALRVVLPVLVGQLLQKTSETVVDFVKNNKKHFKKAQQYCLIFIVYTVFCRTFEDESQSSIGDIFIMVALQFGLLCSLMVVAWYSLKLFFPNEPKLRVMGLFGCTHKTVAMGVPLINAIYESDPLVGLYTLPLLVWHPMQLLVGSFLAPKLLAFVKSEQERLGIVDEEVHEETPSSAPEPKGESDEELGLVESKKEIESDANDMSGTENGKGQHSGVVDNEANESK